MSTPFSSLSRRVLVAAAAVMCLPATVLAAGDPGTWPKAKPITWIVGYVPGGSVDVITRSVAKVVSDRIGQSIVIDNRAGASGAIALQYAARAANDGYWLITVPGPIIHAEKQPTLGRELSAVSLISQGPIVLVGAAANARSNLQDLIGAMKKNPQDWSYASSGTGTGQHLAGELFNTMAGTKMIHVPYKGGGQAVTDVVGGQVSLGMLGVTPVLPQINAGKLKAYAVTTPFRLASLPDVPTMSEAGLKGYEATQFFIAAVPARTDAAIIMKLNKAIAEAMKTPEVKAALEAAGQVPSTLGPAEADAFAKNSIAKFDAVAKQANISLK